MGVASNGILHGKYIPIMIDWYIRGIISSCIGVLTVPNKVGRVQNRFKQIKVHLTIIRKKPNSLQNDEIQRCDQGYLGFIQNDINLG